MSVAAEQAAEATRVTAAIAGTEQGLSKLSGHVKRLETYIDTNAAVQRASRAFARKGISLHHRHRVALDLQACQTKDSRNRGIGKYSRSPAEAVVNADHGLDIVACFNQSYPESAEELAQQFEPILGPGRIGRYNAPGFPARGGRTDSGSGRLGGEWIAQYAWTAQARPRPRQQRFEVGRAVGGAGPPGHAANSGRERDRVRSHSADFCRRLSARSEDRSVVPQSTDSATGDDVLLAI